MPRILCTIAPPVLWGVFLLLAITSLTQKNATFDEVAHIPAGYGYLRTGEFRLNPEHPPLAKVLAGLPLLTLGLEDPRTFPEYAEWDQWSFGQAFLYSSGVPAERIVFWARIPLVLLAACLGIFVYRWSRQIHGEAGGLLSLCLFALSPNLLAHSRLVTTDAAVTLFAFLTVYFLWQGLSSSPGRTWIPYGASLALALLSKYTAVVLLPVAAGIGLGWAFLERPRRDVVRQVFTRLAVATIIPIAVVMVFGFGPTRPFAYLEGFHESLAKLNPRYAFYMAGTFSWDGFFSYYLVAFALKTPIPTMIFLGASVLAARRHPRIALLALAVPVILFFLAPSLRRYNIGLRYALPAYPFLFVLAGGAVHLLAARRVYAWIGIALLGWLAAGTTISYPHFIPYFNEIAGGPRGGIRYLDDSNIDWGQDLMALGRIARREGWEGIGVLYHGMALPRYYLPTSSEPSREEVAAPEPGRIYAVSAQIALRTGWLERAEPFRRVGHSIYLYRFPE